ncbi:MAG TPA: ATP-binding protein [Acidobacteriaceae bacterium]|nr:ATP-binding protein [Acidobacteriaceae bacterium]
MNLSQLNRILLQTLMLPVVALLLVSGALIWQIGNAQRTVADIQVADRNIALTTQIMNLVDDEETGLRGYQNTGNEIFLQPYIQAAPRLNNSILQLHRAIVLQGHDTSLLDQFTSAHELWLDTVALPVIGLVQAGGNTRDAGLNLHGKAEMDHIRAIGAALMNKQQARRQAEVRRWQEQVRHTLEGVIGTAVFLGLAIGLFARSRLHLVTHAFHGAIDALRRNAQATYDSEQRLRTTLTSIGDGVVVCNQDGRIELLNTVAEQLTGWRQEEVFHRHVTDVFHIVHESTRELIDNPVGAVLATRHTVSLSNHALLLRRDGSEIHIDDSGAPIFDRSGALAGVVMVFRDVTEQHRTQAALLANEKLAVAGRLAATLAHEIHNPLDSVVNLLYLMKTSTSAAETAEFLDLARTELDRVTQISRAMLSMYRESKTPISINLKDLLESVLLLMHRQLSHAGVTLHKDLGEGSLITGYPAELRQVFTNLLANAADVSPSGSSIEVSLRRTPAVRSENSRDLRPAGVTVAITDHGAGIPADVLDRLFQAFFTTKGEKGTGLGLWVSQGIIQKHGGDIKLDTHTTGDNRGTTISVFLPRGSAAPSTPIPTVV